MSLSGIRARTPHIAGLLLFCVALQGCTTWRRQQGNVQVALSARPERQLRVRLHDGYAVLHDPWIDGDSLRGNVHSEPRDAYNRPMPRLSTPAAFAIADVEGVDVRRFSGRRTALLGATLVGAAFGAMVLAIALSGPWFDDMPSCSFYTCGA